MRGWLAVVIVGAGLAASSTWHAHIGGAGTTGRWGPIVLLAVIAALAGVTWVFRG